MVWLRRAVLLLVALLVVGYGVWCAIADRQLQECLSRLRVMGPPNEFADLATTAVTDEENGFLLLQEAHRWLEVRSDSRQELWSLEFEPERSDWTAEEMDGFHAALDSLAPYFELVERIPSRPGWHEECRWEKGGMFELTQLHMVGELATLLEHRVRLDGVDEGRTQRAAAAALLLFDIADRMAERFLIEYAVRTSLRAGGAGAVLSRAAARRGFDAATFRSLVEPALATALPPAGPPPSVLAGERVSYLWWLERLVSGRWPEAAQSPSEEFGWLYGTWLCRPVLLADVRRGVSAFETAMATSAATPEEAAKRWLATVADTNTSQWPSRPFHEGIIHRAYAEDAAEVRLTRVLMALLEERQQSGEWPQTLEELRPRFADGVPTDPYSGVDFGYECGTRLWVAVPGRTFEELKDGGRAWDLTEFPR